MPEVRVPAVFTKDELWLVRSVVRHESTDQARWEAPLTNLDLNDAIVDAVLMCEVLGLGEAALLLSMKDCLLLDAVIPQDAKDKAGLLLGKTALLKTFAARRSIRGDFEHMDAVDLPLAVGVKDLMAQFEAEEQVKPRPPAEAGAKTRKRGSRNASTSHRSDHSSDHQP